MKPWSATRPFLVLVLTSIALACSFTRLLGNTVTTETDSVEKPKTISAESVSSSTPPIHISIVTHNEEPRSGLYPDYVNDEAAFWEHRTALVNLVSMLKANDVMYNYQSDWNFLLAAGMYDTGTPETGGQNFLRHIKKLGFEVDPHAHESQYSYADVAYLIQELGVTPSNLTGGFIASPPADSKLEYLWHPIQGRQYPAFTWQAEILWGGATSLHIDEESLWVSGIWKPKDNEHFTEHSDGAPLPHIGGCGRSCEQLIQLQQSGELDPEKIYTCTLFYPQHRLPLDGYIEDAEREIQYLNASGKVRWVGLAEVIKIWERQYNSEPNIFSCDW